MQDRIEMLERWFDNGGVLLMGYQMFRTFFGGKNQNSMVSQLEEKASYLQKAATYLLEGSSLVITDEVGYSLFSQTLLQ